MMGKYHRAKLGAGIDNNLHVNFVNESTVVSTADLRSCLNVLQTQISRDFKPAWGLEASLSVSKNVTDIPTIFIVDDIAGLNELGFKDATDIKTPAGFVFVGACVQSGESWQTSASHELLELLLDPYDNLGAQGSHEGNQVIYAYECCDPIGDSTYLIGDIEVSNFIFPSWFIQQTAKSYDHLGVLDAPLTLAPGGSFNYCVSIGDFIEVNSELIGIPHNALVAMPRKVQSPWSRLYKRMVKLNPGLKDTSKNWKPVVNNTPQVKD